MINIINKQDCSGCCACIDICPTKAITKDFDSEGFLYPSVDEKLCINCSLCDNICPDININKLKHNDFIEPECYAAEHKNIEIVFDSTSGGLFSAFAELSYRAGGYVGGAIFNEDLTVSHYLSNNKDDIEKLRSSKYLQSDLTGWYTQVKKALLTGNQVTVCGCPCQMAGLKSFLRKKYDNLLILDFICRGINSPKVWLKYIDSFEERYGSKVVYAKAKSKEYGWRNLTQKFILADGRHVYETKDNCMFTKGYLQTNAYCRPSCYSCKYKGFPRISDITLADFWGVEKHSELKDKDLGVSLVMINSDKGKHVFNELINKKKILFQSSSLKMAIDGNPALLYSLGKSLINRTQFFQDLDTMSFSKLAIKYRFNVSKKSNSKLYELKQYVKKNIDIIRFYRFDILGYLKMLYWNYRFSNISNLALNNNVFLPKRNVLIQRSKKSKVTLNGKFIFGASIFQRSKLETRLFLGERSNLTIDGDVDINYGADIEVFPNAALHLSNNIGANIGLTIICSNQIKIGKDVKIGRNVTIRDNNGGHYINRQGYKDSKPVIIEDKVWLCEGCTILSGVKIGAGAIVGANSLVTRNVPPRSMVVGNPAIIVDENVLWKY